MSSSRSASPGLTSDNIRSLHCHAPGALHWLTKASYTSVVPVWSCRGGTSLLSSCAGSGCKNVVQAGYDVLGGYMSPVNDAYHKKGLAPAQHRVEMCRLAAETSDIVMVDSWEAEQPAYQRSLMVLQRLEAALNDPPTGDALTWRAQALCDSRQRSFAGWKMQALTVSAFFLCWLNSCGGLWCCRSASC